MKLPLIHVYSHSAIWSSSTANGGVPEGAIDEAVIASGVGERGTIFACFRLKLLTVFLIVASLIRDLLRENVLSLCRDIFLLLVASSTWKKKGFIPNWSYNEWYCVFGIVLEYSWYLGIYACSKLIFAVSQFIPIYN